MQKEFGIAIKELREKTGLSQEKFALSIDMDRTYYASVEAEKRNISLQNICKIPEKFGISVSSLFVVVEKQQTLLVKMTAASEDYSKVVDKIYALQNEQKQAMACSAGKERIEEMIAYLKSQPKRVTAYDEQLVRKLIEKTTVYNDHLDFLFKSGFRLK